MQEGVRTFTPLGFFPLGVDKERPGLGWVQGDREEAGSPVMAMESKHGSAVGHACHQAPPVGFPRELGNPATV